MSGYVDLHCHLLWGLDDGAKSLDESLEMARALVGWGFSTVAASPHNRPEYAPRDVALDRLAEVQEALDQAGIPLRLAANAENYLLDETLPTQLASGSLRKVAQGPYFLVEAPYTSPVTGLAQHVFRFRVKGLTPIIAHPERCAEFDNPGRAAEAVQAGALLQLDLGALVGRYGRRAEKLARKFLDDGLYAVAATDLHAPVGTRDWVARSLRALESACGAAQRTTLLAENPRRVLEGKPLES